MSRRDIRFLGGRSHRSTSGFALRWVFIFCSVAFVLLVQSPSQSDAKIQDFQDEEMVNAQRNADDDFAEFDMDEDELTNRRNNKKMMNNDLEDDFDDDEDEFETVEEDKPKTNAKAKVVITDEDDEDEAMVEDEDEFAHFADDEEFEGFSEGDQPVNKKKTPPPPPPKTIKITNVPAHLRNNWESYYLEILMAAGIVVYFINFFIGKSKNQRIANAWFDSNKALLESNFALVGDDGAKDIENIETKLVKESEHNFTLWCSGRQGVEGMLVDIKMLKRQDIVSLIANMMKPVSDQVQIKIHLNQDEMDTFVFCLANKRTAGKLAKEMADISTFCPERRPADKYGVPANFQVMSEISEVTASMLDAKMSAVLNKYPEMIDSVHVSDMYSGPKPTDDQVVTELPEGKKIIIFNFNIPINVRKNKLPVDEAVDSMKPLMLLVFYFLDKIRRYRLSREAKHKAEKNRTKVKDAFWKSVSSVRAERAQEEREKKRRELKERIKEIDDPEKQRKLEEREAKRDKKKNAPKMKQLKVKAM